MTRKTLILGIGNTLLSDEGVGVRTVEHMRAAHPADDVDYLDGGTLSFTLAAYVEEAARLVVIDAADLGGAAGDHACFIGEDMDRFLTRKGRSVHEVSLADVLDISRLREALPPQRILYGIQPGNMDWGEQLTPAVASAMQTTVDLVLQQIQEWREDELSIAL